VLGVALALASEVLSQRRRLRHLAAEHRLQRRYLRLHLYWQSSHLTQVRSGVNIGSAMLQSTSKYRCICYLRAKQVVTAI